MTRLARFIERLHHSMTTHYNASHKGPNYSTKQDRPAVTTRRKP